MTSQCSTRIPILQANDVRCYPVHRRSDVGEPTMNDDVVTFCKNHPRLMLERQAPALMDLKSPSRPGSIWAPTERERTPQCQGRLHLRAGAAGRSVPND